MDPTVDPAAKSFVPYDADSHFPIQNLPYGVFAPTVNDEPRVCTRIGDFVLDLAVIQNAGLLDSAGLPEGIFSYPVLNPFMELDAELRRRVRMLILGLLRVEVPTLRDDPVLRGRALLPVESIVVGVPVAIGDYTDFYASREHATNVGIMFRGKDNALMPNWLHLPVGYHGRASSIIVSGEPITRPQGQTLPADAEAPVFGPCRLLDFELEMGVFVGRGNFQGQPMPVDAAGESAFGLVLVNDWSARDVQKWESQPLGPFNAKNFATSISPWVITMEALAPFRCAAPEQDPAPLPYLQEKDRHTFDVNLEVEVRAEGEDEGLTVCASNYKHLYWTLAQMLAHHTSTGCNMNTGDMIASGTISGPDKGSVGSMLEISWAGKESVTLPGGHERKFLQDGDTVTMTGWCQGQGYRVGFGEVTTKILPAVPHPGVPG